MTDVPEGWRQALLAVQKFYPSAVIAGGALRDLDNGREVKDIDIFVHGCGADDLDECFKRIGALKGFDPQPIDPDKVYPVGDMNDLVGHFDVVVRGLDVPVQIIMLRNHCDVVARIDYGICRISYDGATLTKTREYLRDQQDQVFRMRQERHGFELAASVHRYARLVQKYEGWKFVPFEGAILPAPAVNTIELADDDAL